jgi:hypothetical protein
MSLTLKIEFPIECLLSPDLAGPNYFGAADSAKTKTKELKDRIKDLEHKLAAAEAKLAVQSETKEYAVQAAKFATQIEMQKAVEAAYDKGYKRCEEAMESNMRMLKEMRH